VQPHAVAVLIEEQRRREVDVDGIADGEIGVAIT
jgi:hypothetical protein